MRDEHSFIRTHTGRKFYPLDPLPEEVNIYDIAHSLANQCRWTGHSHKHYSIAQHAVMVSYKAQIWLEEEYPNGSYTKAITLKALHHDSSEAYLTDIPTPVKRQLEFEKYRDSERIMERTVNQAFNLPLGDYPFIKAADRFMLHLEGHNLITNYEGPETELKFRVWGRLESKYRFLYRHFKLLNYSIFDTIKLLGKEMMGWNKLQKGQE